MKPPPEQHHFANRSILGMRLKWWRQKEGLKIAAAAHDLGVSTATWGHWETGHTFPSGEMLFDLCALTGLPLQLLLCPHMEDCPFHTGGELASSGTPCCRQIAERSAVIESSERK